MYNKTTMMIEVLVRNGVITEADAVDASELAQEMCESLENVLKRSWGLSDQDLDQARQVAFDSTSGN